MQSNGTDAINSFTAPVVAVLSERHLYSIAKYYVARFSKGHSMTIQKQRTMASQRQGSHNLPNPPVANLDGPWPAMSRFAATQTLIGNQLGPWLVPPILVPLLLALLIGAITIAR
jgi:hypothetical protein